MTQERQNSWSRKLELQGWKLRSWRQKQQQQLVREVELGLEGLGVDSVGHKSGPVQGYQEINYFNMKRNTFRLYNNCAKRF